MSADCIKANLILTHISHAISKLESTKMKIEFLLNQDLITEQQAANFIIEVDNFIEKVNDLDIGPI
jgi:hypothetical protein